ncbi:MAG: lamin tail domain-containing protein, partial [Planctomycetota bacterium]
MFISIRVSLLLTILAFLLASAAFGLPAYEPDSEGRLYAAEPGVVINEIHYDPDVKTEPVEFVELHNTGTTDVNLAGWYLTGGIYYQFPLGSMLPPGGYIIVAQSPDHILAKWSANRFGVPTHLVFGPFDGKLDNNGEKITLRSADDQEVDEVDYQLGFPWPTVGDAVPISEPGTGRS